MDAKENGNGHHYLEKILDILELGTPPRKALNYDISSDKDFAVNTTGEILSFRVPIGGRTIFYGVSFGHDLNLRTAATAMFTGYDLHIDYFINDTKASNYNIDGMRKDFNNAPSFEDVQKLYLEVNPNDKISVKVERNAAGQAMTAWARILLWTITAPPRQYEGDLGPHIHGSSLDPRRRDEIYLPRKRDHPSFGGR